jgi:hypothetical protein
MNGRRRRWIMRRRKISKKWNKKTRRRKFESLLHHLGVSVLQETVTPSLLLEGIHN